MGSSKPLSSRSRKPGSAGIGTLAALAGLIALCCLAPASALAGPTTPLAETTGSPIRSATSVRLTGRADTKGLAATYHFEYGTAGACDSNSCASTPDESLEPTDGSVPVEQLVDGLQPETTYHYRLVVDNGDAEAPVAGADRTVTTRATDAPLGHGSFPGPPENDRAWEMVSQPELGDNPVQGTLGISSDGEKVLYRISGGTSDTQTGALFTPLYAHRTAGGWQSGPLAPPRSELAGQQWFDPAGAEDLSSILIRNFDLNGNLQYWRLTPGSTERTKLYEGSMEEYGSDSSESDDGSRMTMASEASLDPDFPGATGLYDITDGSPHLYSVYPDGSPALAGCTLSAPSFNDLDNLPQPSHWLSPDGTYGFFTTATASGSCVGNPSGSPLHLYARDFETHETFQVDPDPLSGPDCTGIHFVKSTASWVYFWTQNRLTPDDQEAASCGIGGDVYRARPDGSSPECLTCANGPADIKQPEDNIFAPRAFFSIAENDSRLYLLSSKKLTPDAPSDGGIYRVDLQTKEIALASPSTDNPPSSGALPIGGLPGAVTPDGKVLMFESASPRLNTADSNNGGLFQWYRYDDTDRSLTCISCPPDGSPAKSEIDSSTLTVNEWDQMGPNLTPIADDGTFLFATNEPLVPADQNTAAEGQEPLVGRDIYEWRDGRPLLISDGIYGKTERQVGGISRDGRDAFLIEAAALTPDAPDGLARLYDARLGGGFEYPKPPPPCPLEACQGNPSVAPAQGVPGSESFSGPGNQAKKGHRHKHPKCKLKSKKHKKKCVKGKGKGGRK